MKRLILILLLLPVIAFAQQGVIVTNTSKTPVQAKIVNFPNPIPVVLSIPQWIAKSGAYTANPGDKVLANTTSTSFTITLPASPTLGTSVSVADAQGTFATNNLRVGRNGQNIAGSSDDLIISTNNAAAELVFAGGSMGWQVIRFQ